MLKSCRWCGRIHDSKYDCGRKPKPKPRKHKQIRRPKYGGGGDRVQAFRRTQKWKTKSEEIRLRDGNLCQCCIRCYPGTVRKYNGERVSVHHISPVAEDYAARLDNLNLITLCSPHHEMAEAGKISKEDLYRVAEEQESARNDPTIPPGV